MNQSIALMISIVVGIILSIISNWFYDLLKKHRLLPDKGNIKMMVALIFAFTPIVAFVMMSPQGNLSNTNDAANNGVTIGGDANNSTVFNNTDGDVTINQNMLIPTAAISQEFRVNDLITTNICVQQGDTVSVTASGGITVGPNIGSVGPEGKDSGLFGFPLDQYDIYPEFSHGALLCKIDTEEDWKECGRSAELQAQVEGCLQFDVNDNEKENNSGSFDVTVEVFDQ